MIAQAMAQYFELHPQNPQLRLIRRAAEIVRDGGLIAYPTDSCYALGCHIGDAAALERLRRIRGADRHHHFTLVCRDLSEIARYARMETWQFRMLKAATPGRSRFCCRPRARRRAGCSIPSAARSASACPITSCRDAAGRAGRAADEFDPAAAGR
jgi:tRNA A37 threonylcarbamoyladenosine synthetase subunit TsaC/SUA5/YrdC